MHTLSRQLSLFVQFPSHEPEAGKLFDQGIRRSNLETK